LRWLRIRRFVPSLAYMGLIFGLSSMAHPPVPIGIPDTAYHVPEYFVLTLLLFLALRDDEGGRPAILPRWLPALAMAIFASILYGASDELHQAFVPGRFSEVRDVISDAIGALLAGCLVLVAGRLRRRHPA